MHNRIELKILICIKKPDGYIVLIESEIEEIFCDANNSTSFVYFMHFWMIA